ncbi:MAG: tyrosine--tRNA ligase [Planctomycetota bacterium]|nr:tyrosine--tRNA ligase [Planctomycetota bacterium]
MNLFDDLRWRGSIHQTTDDEFLPAWLADGSRTLYVGFDPTSDGLHVGNFVPLMMLRRFQQAGHKPIALAGGATGMIGDPSGKSEERNLLDVEQIKSNLAAITVELQRFLNFGDGENSATLVNNYDWMRQWDYLSFLRDIGKNFPVNVMLAKDSVKGRLAGESGMSYTEFSYMLLQAYDVVHLRKEFGCQLQVGGSDQWGNITAGIDLARRMGLGQLYGITCPLLTKKDGTKMGKTESGAIWLSPKKTSPYIFYQYWHNVDDEDVGNCLRVLTELPREEIESLDRSRAEDPGRRDSQRRLAEAITLLIHGETGLAKAQQATNILFGAEIDNLSDSELTEIFADVPSSSLLPDRLAGDGLNIIDALVAAGLSKSKGEARRVISQGGAYVNNRRVEGIDRNLTGGDLASETVMVLRSGKKKYALLQFV